MAGIVTRKKWDRGYDVGPEPAIIESDPPDDVATTVLLEQSWVIEITRSTASDDYVPALSYTFMSTEAPT